MNSLESLDALIAASCPKKTTCSECDIEKTCNSKAKEWIDTIRKDLNRIPELETKAKMFDEIMFDKKITVNEVK